MTSRTAWTPPKATLMSAHLDDGRFVAWQRSSVVSSRARYAPRRRLIVSKPTATTSTTPATMFWVGEFAPTKASP